MGFYEGEIYPAMGNNNGVFGNDGIWAIVLFAMIFGWGRNGAFGGNGGGSEMLGYQLGKGATTNDVASGFNNSAVLSSLNDIKLGQASMQNWINQGFVGVDRTTMQGFHGVDNALCTLGYNISQGFNSLSREIADCCCNTSRMIERQTCDLITNQNANTQRIMDYAYAKELEAVRAERDDYKLQASQARQTSAIINALNPTPVPSYTVPNPNCCYPNNCTSIM